MNNVLILNNSQSEFDLIKNFLKKQDFKVYTIGNRQPFVTNGIEHYKLDYTNTPKIEKIIKKKKINLIISCANDLGLYLLLKLKQNKFIDTKKTLDTLLNKFFFRKYYKKIPYYHFNQKIDDCDFPILLKKKLVVVEKIYIKLIMLINFIKLKSKKGTIF